MILFFLFIVAAIVAGGWGYQKFIKPCDCK